MPRKKRALTATSAAAEFSAKEAHVLLRTLQELGHVTAAHLHTAREAVASEIDSLMARLQELKADAVALPAAVRAVRRARRHGGKRQKKSGPVSAKRRQTMILQAQYLRALVGIPKNQRAKYKAMISKIGKEATIKAMEKVTSKKK